LVCTNCGAVLGVRDAVCRKCGGDVRSGKTIMRITEEEKARFGLFRRKPKARAKGKKKERSPMASFAIVLVVLIVLAGLVVGGLLLTRGSGASTTDPAEQTTEAAETANPD
ncbi:unnamed protein product, partial [marine sediment metagenome]